MNKIKLSAAAFFRAVFNAVVVIALVALASLIGVGGAALWIYGRPGTAQAAAKPAASHLRSNLVANDERVFPTLMPVRSDDESPVQLTSARHVPTDAEIATVSDTPRYTYVSYNGGRQQAHLRVNTVLSASVPAPLTTVPPTYDNDITPVQAEMQTALSDPSSRYITNAQGRVVGIDGTAGAAAEARAQQVTIARALPVQPKGFAPEVRVAAPVIVRKAMPVGDEETVAPTDGFNVQAELARPDDRPVIRAQPVARNTSSTRRPSLFGAGDDLRSFGGN